MVIVVAILAARVPFSSETLRRRVIEGLAARLDAEVELGNLELRLLPTMHARGTELRIHHKGRKDVPPLISVGTFTVSASFGDLWRWHVSHVSLEGLDIQIPPDDDNDNDADKNAGPGADSSPEAEDDTDYLKQVIIDDLDAPNARLTILRRDPSKPARVWTMHMLKVRDLGLNSKMPFETALTNAVPPGEITASGTFGPWQRRDPGRTPLDGRFIFENADLGVFDGIGGTLSAKGSFGGRLEVISVDGETTTPDFSIDISGQPVPLTTNYHAVVDATNGNTTLDPVNAKFLQTSLVARGGVYEVPGVKGRVIKLDIAMDSGRLEDIMRLAVKTPTPPMTGRLHLTTKFEIPPGKVDVVKKLKLDGRFAIENGRFTNVGVQTKINELSRRASGKAPEEVDATQKIASNFSGRFQLAGGRLSLPNVAFDVPGAVVELAGSYDLKQEQMDFNGNLFMDAKLSETVTGFKSLLLKVLDPLFRKDGRTVVPLKISGTRGDPQFGLDVRRALRRGGAAAPAPAPGPAKAPVPRSSTH